MKIYIDASNAWYRSYLATMLTPPGGPILIFTYMLRRICTQYGKNNVIICWDSGDGGRKKLDNSYKAQRQSNPRVWEDIIYMKSMIDCLGLANAFVTGFEADDVIGSLTTQSSDKSMILSYDKDFYQLVDDNISILRPERTIKGQKIPQQIVERDAVVEEFGCPPDKVVLCKSFKGDASDNIPKISIRFTKNFSETFYKVLMTSASVEDFYNKIDIFDKKYHQDLLLFKERAKLNEKIIKIKCDLNVTVNQPKLDAEAFLNLCKEVEITKLRFSDWEAMSEEAPPPAPVQNSLF